MAKKIRKMKPWVFFLSLLILMFVLNFTRGVFGISYLWWHLFIHGGTLVFIFLIMIYSLRLNQRATNYVFVGGMIWMIAQAALILSHVFEEYVFLQTNLFVFLGGVIAILLVMKGFKEAVK